MFRSARTRTMASVGILLCLGVISSQGQPSGDTNEGEVTSKGGASTVDTDVADEIHLSSTELSAAEVASTIEFSASSSWPSSRNSYNPSKAVQGGYWCSKRNDPAPFWWISFVEKPIEVVSIAFEENYSGAAFEFFASSGEECAEPKNGNVLIKGTREEISNIKFKNGQRYHCYGLRITKLAQTKNWGALASLKKFQLTIHREDDCNEQSCSGNGDCTDGVFKKTCVCAAGFRGKDCEVEGFASKLNFTIEYKASSSYWRGGHGAEKAMLWNEGYWMSSPNVPTPVYWWMSFNKPVQIVEIHFEEGYGQGPSNPARIHGRGWFVFFASDKCGETGTEFKWGNRWDVDGPLENKRGYLCYGLRITRLPYSYKHPQRIAVIKNFRFRVQGFPEIWLGGDIAEMRPKSFKSAQSEYILLEKETTWETANTWCQTLGSGWYLASMSTREEFDAVATKMHKLRSGSGSGNSCHDSWIGLTYDRKWYWFGRSYLPEVLDSDERWADWEPKMEEQATVAFIRVKGSPPQGKILTANRKSTKLCSFLCSKGKWRFAREIPFSLGSSEREMGRKWGPEMGKQFSLGNFNCFGGSKLVLGIFEQ